MYRAQPMRLSGAQCDQLVALCGRLDLTPGPGGSRFAPSIDPLLATADGWPQPWHYATVVALYPSAQLVAHCDPPIRGTRYHAPIQVNPGCWVFHAGTWQQLDRGQWYQMDPTHSHGAVNWGDTVRLHLLVDTD